MYMATGTLLLCAVTTASGLTPSLNYTKLTPYAALPTALPTCSVTIKNGYVNAVCITNAWLPHKVVFGNVHQQFLEMEQLFVSNEPVSGEPREASTILLSLHTIEIKLAGEKTVPHTDDYLRNLNDSDCNLGIFACQLVPEFIQNMTIKSTFGVPPQGAVAVCNWSRGGRGCNYEILGFTDSCLYNSSHLQYLGLADDDAFWNIPSVRTDRVAIMFSTNVREIPANLFKYFAFTPVKDLIFYKGDIIFINNYALPKISNLEQLHFLYSPIDYIAERAFQMNPYLKYCSLVGTYLYGIPQAIFSLKHLKILNMSNTNQRLNSDFEYCPKNCESNSSVQQLDLGRTNLTSLPNRAFCGFPLLKQLFLEDCHITQLYGSPFECLENLINLTMHGNEIMRLDEHSMKGLKKLTFLSLSKNRIAHLEGLQAFTTLISLRGLSLSHNEIRSLLLVPVEYLPIEQLYLEYNRISTWKPPLFARMSKLKTVLLHHNGLSRLSDDMLHDISHAKYVDLNWNPWDCSSCQLKNLRSLLEKHPSQCTNCSLCKEPDELEGRSVFEAPLNEDACGPPDHFRIYGVPALLSFMITSLVGYAVYRHRWYCIYGLLYLKVAVKGRRRQAQAGDFLWDGFLSYHASDAEWVRDTLLPKLESAPMGFRLCVAERNFIPGVPITENICRAITQSRVSLFVLSREFCCSRWCMFEVSLAQHRLSEDDRCDSMVFIRKNDVEVSEMNSTLAYLINSRTYVQLPSDGSSQALHDLFWIQVQTALDR